MVSIAPCLYLILELSNLGITCVITAVMVSLRLTLANEAKHFEAKCREMLME